MTQKTPLDLEPLDDPKIRDRRRQGREMYRDQLFVYQEYLDKVAKRTEAGKPARHGTGSDVGATTATKCHLRQCASCHVQFEEWESGCKPACDECRDAFRERERADPERGKLTEDPAGSCKSQ